MTLLVLLTVTAVKQLCLEVKQSLEIKVMKNRHSRMEEEACGILQPQTCHEKCGAYVDVIDGML